MPKFGTFCVGGDDAGDGVVGQVAEKQANSVHAGHVDAGQQVRRRGMQIIVVGQVRHHFRRRVRRTFGRRLRNGPISNHDGFQSITTVSAVPSPSRSTIIGVVASLAMTYWAYP